MSTGKKIKGLCILSKQLTSLTIQHSIKSIEDVLSRYCDDALPGMLFSLSSSSKLNGSSSNKNERSSVEWSRLEHLDLSNNEIKEIEPQTQIKFAQLTNLTHLILSHNELAYLTDFTSLPLLVYLDASYNKLEV